MTDAENTYPPLMKFLGIYSIPEATNPLNIVNAVAHFPSFLTLFCESSCFILLAVFGVAATSFAFKLSSSLSESSAFPKRDLIR
jgi:hypothetical protein